MLSKKRELIFGREALVVSGIGKMSLSDTMECGQCFRYLKIAEGEGYCEYMTVVGERVVFVAQRTPGELIFFDCQDEELDSVLAPYFSLGIDFEAVREDVLSNTDSEFLKEAASVASGISILSQDPWEALFSFIVSQNNNIPRIKGIIRKICAEYGTNLALRQGITECPLARSEGRRERLDEGKCASCGICYKFPSAKEVADAPERLLPAHPGFRYRYLVDAAEKVSRGDIDLGKIKEEHRYEYTLSQLKRIVGVGDKVASCAALFGFGNYEAFPVDVWMKRAIDTYFGGSLDPVSLGRFAGVAQQYIFHYIRILSEKNG